MRRLKSILTTGALASLVGLAGCGAKTGLAAKTSYSGFDQSAVVTIEPHGAACPTMICTQLGAQWSGAYPKDVVPIVVIVGTNEIISGAAFNINGTTLQLTAPDTLTDHDFDRFLSSSEKGFLIPLSLIDDILAADRIWLRVETPSGYFEDAIIEPGRDSKAYHALGRFREQVDTTQAAS